MSVSCGRSSPTPTSEVGGRRAVDDTALTDDTSSIRKERRRTAKLVKQLSEDSIQTYTMAPDYIIVEVKREETGTVVRKSVYVSDQNGTKTLDLYSGWNPQTQKHKLPLPSLPLEVCQLVTLERLWVSHNKLSSLPDELKNLTVLRELFLHRNNFEEIPECICKLPSLEFLWFSHNRIMSVPDKMAEMTSLKRLHLDFNLIKEFPSSLCQLRQLEVLYLNHNSIHQICENVGNMTKLKRFYLQHNKITEIPTSITRLASVELLNLGNNEIRSIRKEFKQFQSHRTAEGAIISLENNPFVTPQSKTKLSLAGIGGIPPMQPLRTRRHSDQYEREAIRRPTRVSLPMTSEKERVIEYKADTLPRISASHSKKLTSNEH